MSAALPKRVCIDTHALIWHLVKPSKLGKAAKRVFKAIDDGKTEALIPAIVLVELALLREGGRELPSPHQAMALFEQTVFRLLPMNLEQVLEFDGLRVIRDPFDRMIICAARTERVPLLTADTLIQQASVVDTIWD